MVNVRLSAEMEEKIRLIAQMKGLTISGVYRLALEQYCDRELAETKVSRYDDIIGIVEGPTDLSSRIHEIFGEIMREKYDRHHD